MWLDGCEYRVADGHLHRLSADGTSISRTPISIAAFAAHRDRVSGSGAGWLEERIANWSSYVSFAGDPSRRRLIGTGYSNPPWLVALRLNGSIEWVKIVGKVTDCCNSTCLLSGAAVLAHFSSCGRRLTFLEADGSIVSTHELRDGSVRLSTDGGDIAYVTSLDESVAAYHPRDGLIEG